MTHLAQAELVILASADGRGAWSPVLPAAVPDWIKEPDTLARLVAGECAMKADEGESGSLWYRAQAVAEVERIVAAEAKRARKQAKRIAA